MKIGVADRHVVTKPYYRSVCQLFLLLYTYFLRLLFIKISFQLKTHTIGMIKK